MNVLRIIDFFTNLFWNYLEDFQNKMKKKTILFWNIKSFGGKWNEMKREITNYRINKKKEIILWKIMNYSE